MATKTADSVSRLAELSDGAFEGFCDDIAGMFDVGMQCRRLESHSGPAGDLRRHFKRLAAVHRVGAEGVLEGTFDLLFDQGGLFVLSGVVVMLADNRILEHVRGGSMEEATNLLDAEREVGNLLINAWDRVFRENCKGHERFVKADTSVGPLWGDARVMPLTEDAPVMSIVYEMKAGSYPSFHCGVVFPEALVDGFADVADEPTSAGPASQKPSPGTTSDGTGRDPVAGEQALPTEDGSQPGEGPQMRHSAFGDLETIPRQPSGEAPSASPPSASGAMEARASGSEKKAPMPPEPDVETPPDAVDTTALPSEIAARAGGMPLERGLLSFVDPAHVQSAPSPPEAKVGFLDTRADQVMRKDVVWADPEETVAEVLAGMQQHNVGYVLVGREGELEGLVSNSNVQGAISLYLRPTFAKWRRPEDDATLRVKIKWIMSRPVRTVRPDATVGAMIENLCRYGGRCLPVVDPQGAVLGMVTMADILLHILAADGKFTWKGRPSQGPVLLT